MKTQTENAVAGTNFVAELRGPINIPEVFGFDGSMVETIRDMRNPQKLLFLVWRAGKVSITPRLERDGKVYLPPEDKFDAYTDLRLPNGIGPEASLQDLLTSLNSTISKFVDLADEDIFLICLYILSTWFADSLQVVPYLWLVGPLGSGKSTLLRLLHCMCRRAILIGDLRAASILKLSSSLHPTMLIDEFDSDNSRPGAEVRRLLRTGNMQGGSATRNGKLFSTFCPKVISSREAPEDAALASRAVTIRLLPTVRDLPPLDNSTLELVAQEFQPKLLLFRLQNQPLIRKTRISSETLMDLTPRVRDIAQAMAAALMGDQLLEDKLLAVLRGCDREARIQRMLEPEWLVVEALFVQCHENYESDIDPTGCSILVGHLADDIDERLRFRGESFRLSAKKVGSTLNSVGIRTERLGNRGRGLNLTSVLRAQVHELAKRLGFTRRDIATICGLDSGYGGAPCDLCDRFGLTGGLRFVPLRPAARRLNRRSNRRPLLSVVDEVPCPAELTKAK